MGQSKARTALLIKALYVVCLWYLAGTTEENYREEAVEIFGAGGPALYSDDLAKLCCVVVCGIDQTRTVGIAHTLN